MAFRKAADEREVAPRGLLDDDVAHRTLLSLLQARTEGFAEAFSSAAKEAGGFERWAGSNRGALVLAALVRARPRCRRLGEKKTLAATTAIGTPGKSPRAKSAKFAQISNSLPIYMYL